MAGEKSSNGKVYLLSVKYNPNSYFITTPSDINPDLVSKTASIGICGATSTPKWQMEEVEAKIEGNKIGVNLTKLAY